RDRAEDRAGWPRARAGSERAHAIGDGSPAPAGLLRARSRRLWRDDLGADERRRSRALEIRQAELEVHVGVLALDGVRDVEAKQWQHDLLDVHANAAA